MADINIEALKKLSNIMIDCQHAQKIGVQIFNYSGQINNEYVELCQMLSTSCTNILTEVQALKALLPNT